MEVLCGASSQSVEDPFLEKARNLEYQSLQPVQKQLVDNIARHLGFVKKEVGEFPCCVIDRT